MMTRDRIEEYDDGYDSKASFEAAESDTEETLAEVKPEEPMTLDRFVALTDAQRQAWLDSPQHRYHCAAYSEGLECCLEKLWRRGP